MKYIFLILAIISIVLANRGRQITIWNPLQTTPSGSPVLSFRPTNILLNQTLRRDHLFTPAMSQDPLYSNYPHCTFGHEMYCNGKFYNYTLDGGQNYWGYDEVQNGLYSTADGYSNGYGYDYYDGAWYDIPEKLYTCGNFTQHHAPMVSHTLNIPTHFQDGQNRDLYVKMAHFWQNLDNQTPLPADQCYTINIDVLSMGGDLGVGLATRQNRNGHDLGFGHPIFDQEFNDTFVGFFRNVSSNLPGSFLLANLINGTEVEHLQTSNTVQCATAQCSHPTSFLITIEVCNKTTIRFQETHPLGKTNSLTYYPASHVFDVDLRGNGSVYQSIDVAIFGDSLTDVFVVTAKALPKIFTTSRVLYTAVMSPDTIGTDPSLVDSSATTLNDNQYEYTSNTQYDESNEPQFLDDPSKLVCFRLNSLTNGIDYLIDVGLFAESNPPESSADKSLIVGLKQGNKFVGFNRLGYFSDSLGNVITANVTGNYLTGVTRMDRVVQNLPSNGIVQSSGLTAPLFNVKFAVYGKSNSGVSVLAGTPDSPPYTFVWAAVESFNLDSQPIDLCIYHQAESIQDVWTPNPTVQWKNITTLLNGLTFSIENAEFGCDGKDLSEAVFDRCGVCGGNNECVACNGIPHSDVVLDACGVCGGDNTTCCTNRFGISDSLWDFLLLPHIISDVSQRLESLSNQLTTTCSLLDSFSNLCNPVSPSLLNAFNDIELGKHQVELHDFNKQCLNNLQTVVTEMLRDVSVYVPLKTYGYNL